MDDSGSDQYLYGATGLYAHVTSSQTYYYLTDGLGSVLAEVKSDGTNVVSYQYDVYGNVVNQQGSIYDERQFAASGPKRRTEPRCGLPILVSSSHEVREHAAQRLDGQPARTQQPWRVDAGIDDR